MKIIEITGENACGRRNKSRTACRGIVTKNGKILLSYETVTDTWMIPGGGLAEGEDDIACCIREMSEETGLVVSLSECALEIKEYYGDFKYISRYYFGTPVDQCERNLTEREAQDGLEPRWIPIPEAVKIFSKHALFADTDEMKRGLYLREYTALCELSQI